MGTIQDLRKKNPAHPGRFVMGEIVTAMGLSPEMAPRIEKVICVSMVTLLRMHTSYDIARTRERGGKIDLVPFPARHVP